MSASVPDEGAHRKSAKGCLDGVASALNEIPLGKVRTDVMLAHSAKAQAIATAAVAHALLEIGDVLRTALKEQADE
jgi:hypothetical protein